MNFIKFGCCLVVRCLVFLSLVLILILSLGVDDPIESECAPQQHFEQQQQQGKLFDHINPIFCKSLLYFTTCIHAWLFVFKLWLVAPIDA